MSKQRLNDLSQAMQWVSISARIRIQEFLSPSPMLLFQNSYNIRTTAQKGGMMGQAELQV